MGRARYLIVLAALAFALPSRAFAEAPQIYAASGPDYTVALKVEAGYAYVLALDSPVYCNFSADERFPGTMSMFQAPTLMREGEHGLEAPIRPAGGPDSYVSGSFDGSVFTGAFVLDVTEEGAHCQTVGFHARRPQVKFRATRYEPAGGAIPTKPAAKGETPLYYGREGGVEVLLENAMTQVEVRGAAPARCPISGKKPAGGRAPLFDDVTDAARGVGGNFLREIKRDGQAGARAWSESTSISGVVGDEEIAGFYERTTKVAAGRAAPRRCTTGPLHFRALRYLPAAG